MIFMHRSKSSEKIYHKNVLKLIKEYKKTTTVTVVAVVRRVILIEELY